MTTLDYRSALSRKAFHFWLFIPSFAALLLVALFYLCVRYHDYTYLGPPLWLTYLKIVSNGVAAIGTASALVPICLIAFRFRSKRQLILVLAASMFFLLGIPSFQLMAVDTLAAEYRHPPYMRLMGDARGLSQSALVYAYDHGGSFPPHLASLILTDQVRPKYLCGFDLVPYASPSPLPPESEWRSIATAVAAHSIFIYTAADLADPDPLSLDTAIIVAYTQPCRVAPNHRILAFVDGHAEKIADADLPKYFTASNAARAKMHLQPFALDGPPPTR